MFLTVHHIVSTNGCHRKDSKISFLKYTDVPLPSYIDKFFQVRQMISLWNKNMTKIFQPGWLTCLDESMSRWFTKLSCPGWVFCPRKPHPFGNEYHSICCSQSGIMFGIEMVEGKDRPPEIPKPDTDRFGPTVGLLLRLTKPIHWTRKVVILDSGFCVLQGILELEKLGVYASALIKKRRYWPKHVPGDALDARLRTEQIGKFDAVKGKKDGIDYHYFIQKDKDYTIKLMSTYGALIYCDSAPMKRRHIMSSSSNSHEVVHFKHCKPFQDYYKARHCVDDHNNVRHSVPSIEGTWITHRWENRVFAFLLSISEVNAFKAFKYFSKHQDDLDNQDHHHTLSIHSFRRKLAHQLIQNDYIQSNDPSSSFSSSSSSKKRKVNDVHLSHSLEKAPAHAKTWCARNRKWQKGAADRYQRYKCKTRGCKTRCKTYCTCNKGWWMCLQCFGKHMQLNDIVDRV